jgi:alanine dehydrogenase
MLFIHNEVSEQVLEMADVIAVQEDALRQAAEGTAVARPRIDVYVPCDREDGYWRWGTMEGANGGYFAIRMKSDIMTWPEADQGHRTAEKYCIEPGTFCGLIMLFSTRNGEPLALINDGILQHMRVGGAAGIGVKHMAREDSEELCILGSGGMARTYLVMPTRRSRAATSWPAAPIPSPRSSTAIGSSPACISPTSTGTNCRARPSPASTA